MYFCTCNFLVSRLGNEGICRKGVGGTCVKLNVQMGRGKILFCSSSHSIYHIYLPLLPNSFHLIPFNKAFSHFPRPFPLPYLHISFSLFPSLPPFLISPFPFLPLSPPLLLSPLLFPIPIPPLPVLLTHFPFPFLFPLSYPLLSFLFLSFSLFLLISLSRSLFFPLYLPYSSFLFPSRPNNQYNKRSGIILNSKNGL